MVATTKKTPKKGFLSIHQELWAIPLFLFAFGVIQIFSASRFKGVELKDNEFYFAILHFFGVSIGIIAMSFTTLLSSNIWKKLSHIIYAITIALLVGVLFTPAVNGAHRWFEIPGTGFAIQPSEFAKITVVLYGAYLLEAYGKKNFATYKQHLEQFLRPVAIRMLPLILLVVIEPDLGTAVVMVAAFVFMYFMKENKFLKQDIMAIGIVLLIGGVVFSLVESYRVTRINTYFTLLFTGKIEDEFGAGYQLRNILIGVGSGGWWGKGLGQSRQRFGYLVETTAFTDSISAVIFEELGYILSVIFISLYLIYFWSITKRAEAQTDQYKKLVLWGMAGWFISQTFIHLSANLALIPVKGIPLPFITYGMSSIISIGIAAGITYRFSRS
ncbi:MAG: FtsW/RodA/SpoVE family cell cycle protein [Candidatus Dojkabacteria bacterium]|nr:MAG: FtsW/RodA/SpoVE family cell cycle protein [Candidatus Dojkabacteria bacterium]